MYFLENQETAVSCLLTCGMQATLSLLWVTPQVLCCESWKLPSDLFSVNSVFRGKILTHFQNQGKAWTSRA